MENTIRIRGARQHNLKNIDLDIPKNKIVVFTGVSGSGKSSLAFDTIYAEGQRRYVESLSTYARQFLGIMEKPDIDLIEGLSPAISIDQKTTSRNPRSTVGTVTEIYDYLRLLFSRIGHPHCPICGREIASQTVDEIVSSLLKLLLDKAKDKRIVRILILSPVISDKKGEFSSLFVNLKSKGYKQLRVDNIIKNTGEDFFLIKTNKHTIEAVIDKISFSFKDLKNKIFADNLKARLTDSIEQALKLSDGKIIATEVNDDALVMPEFPKKFDDHLFSEKFACPNDNIQITEIEPRSFSFNSPHGACATCSGIGKILKIDSNLVFSPEISIREGGILPYSRLINKVCLDYDIDTRLPIKLLSSDAKNLLLAGTADKVYEVEGTNRFGRVTKIYEAFSGIMPELERKHKDSTSDWVRSEIEKYMRENICPDCHGTRLKKESLSVTINKLSIAKVSSFTIGGAYSWINILLTNGTSPLNSREINISNEILKEILLRLSFLISVGLNYLTLDRNAGSLSGGEAQRIRLASQIGSGLTGVLYVLDEPTVGLHQKDNQKLIDTLKKLRDLGNSIIVVEHDREMMTQSDYIFDFGPGAGKLGGSVIAAGTPFEISTNAKSITGLYLSGKKKIDISKSSAGITSSTSTASNQSHITNHLSKSTNHQSLTIFGCSQYNLKNINVTFPLSKLVVITGVSGSGKSTLLVETLYAAMEREFNSRFRGDVGTYKTIEGLEKIDKVILIDQSPIGRTPRSNPATYTKVFDSIRDVFSFTHEARAAGFKKSRFSFNMKGGRCEACEGQGQERFEMQFMSDIWITCDICKGTRYNTQTLEIGYKGKNIADVLKMSVDESLEFFHNHPKIVSKLSTLQEVGLGYIELGQSATTLSGGEAQRVKLSSELTKKATGRTAYILDEPTTGLHFSDVEKLLRVLKRLVSKGNSVYVIEHNLDVIKNADWIIDLGPEGGEKGGEIIAQGTPNDIKKIKGSHTAKFLSNTL